MKKQKKNLSSVPLNSLIPPPTYGYLARSKEKEQKKIHQDDYEK